jgi:hypothetical protein
MFHEEERRGWHHLMGEGEEGTPASFGMIGGGREGAVQRRTAGRPIAVAALTMKQVEVGDDSGAGLLGWLGHEQEDRATCLLGHLGLQQADQRKQFGPNWMIQ